MISQLTVRQRYNLSGHYAHHYDWAAASKQSRRVSTFMVYLSAECLGGGVSNSYNQHCQQRLTTFQTNFPRLQMPTDQRWCEFIECDSDPTREGVTFKARKGAAVFWMNFNHESRGYKETIHAGMPVTRGTKVGLNIWSWYQAGHSGVG